MKLFQIEEPDGAVVDRDAPGAAVGIELAGSLARVAIAIGGNAEILPDADGNRALDAAGAALPDLLLALRARAEKQLARPATHAVIAADGDRDALSRAAAQAGLQILRLVTRVEATKIGGKSDDGAALGAAIIAEDLSPHE